MKHIGKTFPGVVALDDVHFELAEGKVHCLLGENGAGKSTLLKILSGALQKTEGQIFLQGEEIQIKNPRQAQKLGISTIYQELNLVPYLTVAENIYLGNEPLLLPGVIDRERLFESAQEILEDIGAKIDVGKIVNKLGIAQQQVVEVAKALSLEAKILIMDEPTSALTQHEIKQLFATIWKLKSKGVSIIYISHRIAELFEIGDRVTVLRDGKVIGTHQTNQVTKTQLIHEMVNRELTEQIPKKSTKIGAEVFSSSRVETKWSLK